MNVNFFYVNNQIILYKIVFLIDEVIYLTYQFFSQNLSFAKFKSRNSKNSQ